MATPTPDTYEFEPGTPLYAGVLPPPAAADITTLTLVPDANRTGAPVTFGQPFKAGDFNPATQDVRVFDGETMLASQTDEIALHPDGTVRFAVMSAVVPAVANGVQRELKIRSVPKIAPVALPNLVLPADWQYVAEATIYRRQVTRLRFTDRTTGGYVAGETITIAISGIGPTETYTHTILSGNPCVSGADPTGKGQEGACFGAGERIARAIVVLAQGSANYNVSQINNRGYERIWITAKNPSAGAFTVTVTYAGTAVITQTADFTYEGAPQVWSAAFHTVIAAKVASLNAGTPTTGVRLRGAACTEFEVQTPFMLGATPHPHLMARAKVRLYDNGARVRTDLILENNFSFKADPRPVHYSLAIKHNGVTAHTVPAFTHFYQMRWHKIVWFNENADIHFKHNVPYFIDSKAVHNYDRNLVISSSRMDSNLSLINTRRAAQAEFGPLCWLLWQSGMGTTGGREDLGPEPSWFVMHLLSQDPRAKSAMIQLADATGAWDIHYRDEINDEVLSIERHPAVSSRDQNTSIPQIPRRGPSSSADIDFAPTTPDKEHQPELAYYPYLVTGEAFYLEQLMYWASWNVTNQPVGYRRQEKGIMNNGQTIRAEAWTVRTLANCGRILPETHPQKGTYVRITENNFNEYANVQYVAGNPDVSPLKMAQATPTSTSSTWQHDFLVSTASLNADNGVPNAKKLLDWIGDYTVQRMTRTDICFRRAAANRPGGTFWLPRGANGQYLTTWAAFYAHNMPGDNIELCSTYAIEGYPTVSFGQPAITLGTLAACDRAGLELAEYGYERLKAVLPSLPAAFANDPTWAIVPVTATP